MHKETRISIQRLKERQEILTESLTDRFKMQQWEERKKDQITHLAPIYSLICTLDYQLGDARFP